MNEQAGLHEDRRSKTVKPPEVNLRANYDGSQPYFCGSVASAKNNYPQKVLLCYSILDFMQRKYEECGVLTIKHQKCPETFKLLLCITAFFM